MTPRPRIAPSISPPLATDEYGDRRSYYEIGNALVVCRDGLDLAGLINRVVDATVGWDTAMPGFTADDGRIGQARTKITIYRLCGGGRRYDAVLSEVLAR